jgi:glycine/D-amino acid oxidase-like deaminating enzyme
MYQMKPKQLPYNDSYDVIVAGGGPAGCAAAASAAREGAKTLLIEATDALGGMGTSGLIPFWCGFSNGGGLTSTGLGKRILEAVQSNMPHIKPGTTDGAIDPEALKRVYDELVTSFGADVLFNTMLSDVDADDSGNINAVIISNKAGLSAYKAKVYVDCTGDADLIAWAGGEFEKGDGLGEMQPSTLCFMLTNVDLYAYQSIKMNPISPDEKYPLIIDRHSPNCLIGPGTVGFNAGHIHDVDNTIPQTVSAALIKGRKLALQIRNQLAERNPAAFGNAFLAATASMMGVRESRRIKGDYTLTVEDYKARRTFPDEICRNSYPFDSHETKHELVSKFYDLTEKGGYLFIGHAESLNRELTKYKFIMPAVYRKE